MEPIRFDETSYKSDRRSHDREEYYRMPTRYWPWPDSRTFHNRVAAWNAREATRITRQVNAWADRLVKANPNPTFRATIRQVYSHQDRKTLEAMVARRDKALKTYERLGLEDQLVLL